MCIYLIGMDVVLINNSSKLENSLARNNQQCPLLVFKRIEFIECVKENGYVLGLPSLNEYASYAAARV